MSYDLRFTIWLRRAALALLLPTINSQLSTTFAQGSLTPPGAPAPTMKALDQIEPRTAITNLPYTITQPGSYYLLSNLTGPNNQSGIFINVDDVTVDLMGFELVSGGGSVNVGIGVGGIFASHRNVTVRNGTVRGWAGGGVNAMFSSNIQLEGLRAFLNGNIGLVTGPGSLIVNCIAVTNSLGILVGNGSTVKNCVVSVNAGEGIEVGGDSTVIDCTVSGNAARGIVAGFSGGLQCTVVHCNVSANTGGGIVVGPGSAVKDCASNGNTGHGINAGTGSNIADCSTRSNTTNGITAGDGCRITGCVVNNNGARGIQVQNGSTVSGCVVTANASDGIYVIRGCVVFENNCRTNATGILVQGNANRIEANTLTDNGTALNLAAGGNLIVRNAWGGTGFKVVSGGFDSLGPIFIGPGSITNGNASINYDY